VSNSITLLFGVLVRAGGAGWLYLRAAGKERSCEPGAERMGTFKTEVSGW